MQTYTSCHVVVINFTNKPLTITLLNETECTNSKKLL